MLQLSQNGEEQASGLKRREYVEGYKYPAAGAGAIGGWRKKGSKAADTIWWKAVVQVD